jgi:hypothetical protein
MILVGSLSAQAVRQKYLRGLDLGAAWQGPGGDQALDALLMTELARAEELMAIHWQRWRVAAPPESTAVAGTDYDTAHAGIPYVLPREGEDFYRVTLWHHDVQAIARVRLWTGMSADVVPVPVYTLVPLDTVTYDYPEEALHIPQALVSDPTAGLEWAVDYIVGVGQLPLSVVQWCELGVAIQAISLGSAAKDVSHGLSAERLFMDGIEESVNYGSSGTQGRPGGIYAGTVATLQNTRDDIDLVKLRFRYQGSHFPVPGLTPPTPAPIRP